MDTSLEACNGFIGTGPVDTKAHLVKTAEEKNTSVDKVNDNLDENKIAPAPITAKNEIVVIDDDSELELTQ